MSLGEKLRSAMDTLRKATTLDKDAIKEAVKEIQRALISADVEVSLVLELSRKIEAEAFKEMPEGFNRKEHAIKVTYDLLAELLGGEAAKAPENPRRILLVGTFGHGKCVHPSTRIPLSDGTIKTIEEMYDSCPGTEQACEGGMIKDCRAEVFSLDPFNLKVVQAKANRIWKLKKTEDLIKVRLDNGNNHVLSVTPEHPFFVLNNGTIEMTRADELHLSQFVALPKKITFNEDAGILEKQFREKMPQDIKIKDKPLADFARALIKTKYSSLQKAYGHLTPNVAYCTLTAELKQNTVRAEFIEKIGGMPKCPLSGGLELSFAHSHGRPIKFPLVFNENFAEFLGYVYGDGHLRDQYVEITNDSPEVIERFSIISKKLFGKLAVVTRDKRRKNLFRAVVCSTVLVRLLCTLFGLPLNKKSRIIYVPKIILASRKKEKAAFLRAYFDCDGHIAKKQRAIEFSTASRKFAEGLRILVLSLGLFPTFLKKKINGKNYYLVTIKSKDVETFAKHVGSVVPFKLARLNKTFDIGLRQGFGKHEMLAVGPVLRDIREYYGASVGEIEKKVKSYGQYETKGAISRNSLKKFLSALKTTKNLGNKIILLGKHGTKYHEILETVGESRGALNSHLFRLKEAGYIAQQAGVIQTTRHGLAQLAKVEHFDCAKIRFLELLSDSDIAWVKVRGLGLDESTEFVYDLTVEENHNFVANEIFVHNTTTTGKLAKWYAKRGKSVGLVAADVFRPAAVEQLRQVAEKAKVEFFGIEGEKNAAKVVEKGLEKLHSKDLVIVDSAGRSALDEELVKEIKEISSALKPDETWLVLGADIGQIAKKQAQAFHDAVGVNGVIITKMDGSAKGGGVLAACHETKASVYFIGTGEKLDDFEEFDATRYLSRIMGFGDLQALLEKAKEIGEDESALSPEEMLEGEFNFKVFYGQLKATKKLGPISKVAEMLGMKMQVPKEQLEIGQEKMDSFGIIIDSMTEQERKNPGLLTRTRIHRIAMGSGRKEEDVRELIKQYRTMEKMFKKFKSIGSEKKLEKMAKSGNFGGMLQGFAKKKKKFRLK